MGIVDAETSGRGDPEEEGNATSEGGAADGEDGLGVEGEFEATHDAWLDRVDDDCSRSTQSRILMSLVGEVTG